VLKWSINPIFDRNPPLESFIHVPLSLRRVTTVLERKSGRYNDGKGAELKGVGKGIFTSWKMDVPFFYFFIILTDGFRGFPQSLR
jgi:hypothetical protein